MTEYISFTIEDPDGNPLERAFVTLIDEDGVLLDNAMFGTLTEEQDIPYFKVEPGTYTLWVQSYGLVFDFPLTIEVLVGEGPDPENLNVFTLRATSSSLLAEEATHWCRVFGSIGQQAPQDGPSRRAAGVHIVERFAGTVNLSTRMVAIHQMTPLLHNDPKSLRIQHTYRVSVDANGYFEALIPGGNLYRIHIPGDDGSPYFQTPEETTSVEVKELIDAYDSVLPYDTIAGI